MSSPFFSDDKGNKLFGKDDPTIKAIKDSADSGSKFGVDKTGFGQFPAPLIDPISGNGSLGDWKSSTPNFFLPYPGIDAKSGYTKPILTEYENQSFDEKKLVSSVQPTSDRVSIRKSNYNFYKDYSGKQFTHLLDYFQDQNSGLGHERIIPAGQYSKDKGVTVPNTKNIYMGSFIRTTDDNEDPTMLGYDLEIKTTDSPLFNGSIDSFIQQMSGLGNSEIGSRKDILDKFKTQFFKFIKNELTSNSPLFDGTTGVKTYYLRNLGGLDNLNETNDSSKIKSFVDYGNEFITLEFNEDVTQNIGYLGSLYKMLSWSRINGKQIIPENLLRFDIDITITEVRKYNKVFAIDKNNVEVYADLISKYTYTLYECQFFFPTLPHGDAIDMSAVSAVEKYAIKFNYKYSTMKFTKFEYDGVGSKNQFVINNRFDNITRVKSNQEKTTSVILTDGSISTSLSTITLDKITSYSEEGAVEEDQAPTGPIEVQKKTNSLKDRFKKAADTLKKDLTNAVIKEANRRIVAQASLLNKTLDNIRNAIPGAGRMSAPTNVYGEMAGNLFVNDLTNAARNFVGNSIKSFFTKP